MNAAIVRYPTTNELMLTMRLVFSRAIPNMFAFPFATTVYRILLLICETQ